MPGESPDELSRPPIDSSSLALVICDMQNDFIHDEGAFAIHSGKTQPGKSIVPIIKKILDTARAAQLPIFYTKVVNRKDGVGQSSRTSRRIGALMEGTWGTEIVDELAPAPNDFVIVKWRFSAFYSTGFEVMLRGLSIKTIALCGVSTSGGIDSNARDAEYRDINVVVLGDACTDKNQKLHEADLERLGSTFGRVMNSGSVKNWGPQFKISLCQRSGPRWSSGPKSKWELVTEQAISMPSSHLKKMARVLNKSFFWIVILLYLVIVLFINRANLSNPLSLILQPLNLANILLIGLIITGLLPFLSVLGLTQVRRTFSYVRIHIS